MGNVCANYEEDKGNVVVILAPDVDDGKAQENKAALEASIVVPEPEVVEEQKEEE